MFEKKIVFLHAKKCIVMKTNLKRYLLILLINLLPAASLTAQNTTSDALTRIEQRLRQAPVQEKIYVHMDNTCYYKGDNIWYKVYLVRADSLTYSDMSRMAYVELVSPDGIVVERQTLICSPDGYSCGSFALPDSLYSGYYELRAYTRWMLNFGVSRQKYTKSDGNAFYPRELADDFYRLYSTPYSRVFPVYERPAVDGEYQEKYILGRSKMRLDQLEKKKLQVQFYPEGGHLVAGTRCRVAFEAYNQNGQSVDVKGSVGRQNVQSEHDGRGVFEIDVPQTGKLTGTFQYDGQTYTFNLPDVESRGASLALTAGQSQVDVRLSVRGHESRDFAAAVLCRGTLRHFQRFTVDDRGEAALHIDKQQLPTGVNDLMIINANGQPVADRLFFVNHNDYANGGITVSNLKDEYAPAEEGTIDLHVPAGVNHVSVSVRDGATDDPTYNTGTILSDLLLSSELKGFIPDADYYFQADDDIHRRSLDILMMVQGWRRYDYSVMVGTTPLRYQPETGMTVEGHVYPFPSFENFDELTSSQIEGMRSNYAVTPDNDWDMHPDNNDDPDQETTTVADVDYAPQVSNQSDGASRGVKLKKKVLKKPVTLRGELTQADEVAEVEVQVGEDGRFAFSVPPFYGNAVLFLMAYDSDQGKDGAAAYKKKGWRDEKSPANYYVKRDLFFPVFAKKYNYYECHQPDNTVVVDYSEAYEDDEDQLSSMDRTLDEVKVKAKRRRSLHRVDYSQPLCVMDTYQLFNLCVDYGLSRGFFQFSALPEMVTRMMLGTNNPYQNFNVSAKLDGKDVFSNDKSASTIIDEDLRAAAYSTNTSEAQKRKDMTLARQNKTALYSDISLRELDKPRQHSANTPDVWIDFRVIPDGGERYTYRDRRVILDGFHLPAQFYQRNYRADVPASAKDYRRTLYWNPNAKVGEDGRVSVTFSNNGKTSRLRVSSVGLTTDGQPVFNR